MNKLYYIVDLTNKYMTRIARGLDCAHDVCHDLNQRRPDARFTVRHSPIYKD